MSIIAQLEKPINSEREIIARKDEEITRLKAALAALLRPGDEDAGPSQNTNREPKEDAMECEREDDNNDVNGSDGDLNSEAELPPPLFEEDAYRCVECYWEVVDGECAACGKEHLWDEDMAYDPTTVESDDDADRTSVPRGDTPLMDLRSVPWSVSRQYASKVHGPLFHVEYDALLQRGATPLMCETFRLEFTYESGIFAWADQALFDEFSGPAMKEGHRWKISLGRRVSLDPGDLDGASFIEALLEEAALYWSAWETLQEPPESGIWVTRLKTEKRPPNSDKEPIAQSTEGGSDQSSEPEYYYGEGPLREDEYETDDDGSEADEVMDNSANPSVKAQPGLNRLEVFASDDSSMSGMEYDLNETDDADSDFDEDETMSGDEAIFDEATNFALRVTEENGHLYQITYY